MGGQKRERRIRKIPSTAAKSGVYPDYALANGLSPVLFDADGIGALFSSRCGGCHERTA